MSLAVRAWLLFSALIVGSGWILSTFRALNRVGYGIVFALTAAVIFLYRTRIEWPTGRGFVCDIYKLRRRFQRPAPFLFLVLVLLSFISGVLYPPHNSDTYSYRLPRVLHWLGERQWHWVHTADNRMNVAACGYEWFVAPLVLFTHTDRFLFLINWIPFLMLPGAAFSVLNCFGLRPRVAWWWAWLLSSGWCYVMQSASVANDSFAVIYALAAVALALKSQRTGNTDFWLSVLAVALMTGVKQTALPIVLLWMLAVWPQRRLPFTYPKTFILIIASSILVSVVPITIANIHYTGTWTGLPAIQREYPDWKIQLNSPFWGVVGNAFYIPVLNLLPPFFPWSGAWNHMMDNFVATPFGAHFSSFEHFGVVEPGVSESSAGIGLAIVVMTAISIWAARKYSAGPPKKFPPFQTALRLCPWILLIIFMAKIGETQNCRFLAAYYVFFFPSLLAAPGHKKLVRKRWWQVTTLLCMTSSAVLLVVNASRPLFPAVTITQKLSAGHPRSRIFSMLRNAYLASRSLGIVEQQIRESLPANEPLLGYAARGNGQIEPSLWLPFSTNRIERVLKTDGPEQLIKEGVHYVVIENWPSLECTNIAEWMTRYNATLMSDLTFQEQARDSVQSHVYIMRLDNK